MTPKIMKGNASHANRARIERATLHSTDERDGFECVLTHFAGRPDLLTDSTSAS